MTVQEIREMLDSTITANGKREISGQSLNAALNAMVDVLEEEVTNAPNALIYKNNLDYEKLQFGTTYYVMSIDEDDENRHFLDSILVCLQLYDPTGANRGYAWFNIKDGAFEEVYNWR